MQIQYSTTRKYTRLLIGKASATAKRPLLSTANPEYVSGVWKWIKCYGIFALFPRDFPNGL